MAAIARAFERAHLTRNPFGEPSPEERVAIALLRVSPPAPGGKLQLIGAKGAGKTSALRAMQRVLPGAHYAWTPPEGRLAAPVPAHGPVLLDEADRLRDRRMLRALLASPRTVVLGTHADLSALAPGGMTTLVLDDAPRALLDDIVRARLAWAQRGTGAPPAIPAAVLDELHRAHRGNLRAIEHALYFWAQEHWS